MTADFSWTAAPPVRAVMDALAAKGEARFVGGCVRDSLLGRPPAPLAGTGEAGTTDIDVATDLLPQESMAALKAAGLAAHPTGLDHGTVTAVADGLPVEVTTLRADVNTDGRHAEVRFTEDWDEDWRRRDFTVNALYRTMEGEIVDPAGGVADLKAGRVRFIGDAVTRIREDYLRILRFFRFSSRYAAAVDEEGLAACAAEAAGMARLSKERIWQETAKLFGTPRAPAMLRAAHEAGVLKEVLASPPALDDAGRLHELLRAEIPPPLGLEALWPKASLSAFKAAFKPAAAVLSRVETARAAAARLTPEHGAPLARALYLFGREGVLDAALLHAARSEEAAWLDLHERAARETVPVFPVKGRDLLKRGAAKGPALGEALSAIEAAWLSAGCPSEGDTLERMIGRALGEEGGA